MVWVKIDDGFPEHPKVLSAGPLAMAMQIAALCYCNRNLTDGFIPRAAALRLLDFSGIGMRMWSNEMFGGGEDASCELVIDDLVNAGMWDVVPGGWQIHDYLEFQPSKAEILAEREKTKQRVDKWRARNAVTNAVGNAVSNAAPVPVPVPVPDIKKEKEEAADAAQVLPPLEPPNPKKAIFDDGLRWLASSTKRPERSLRPLVGKWIRARGDPEVAAALIAAQQNNPVDPISWIEARLKTNGQRKPSDLERRRHQAAAFLDFDGGTEAGGAASDQAPAGEALVSVPFEPG